MPYRQPFDPSQPLVAARGFIFAGVKFAKGDPFPTEGFSQRLIRRQYEAHAVVHPEPEVEETDPVQMAKAKKNGYFTITAPWLERPLTVRGKVKAEKALAEMREEGAPLGFIDGGSDVEIEESGGGWYQIDAPWLAEPEKVQGRDAAEERQRAIHTEGPPEGWVPEDGRVAATAPTEGAPGDDPAPEDADENAAKAETTDGAEQADATDNASDTGASDDRADGGAAGDEAGKSEDPPADA